MRPVNLIPTEERAGERRPMRGGPLAYVIVGALAAAVIGVALLATTGNQIAESKAEISRLKAETSSVESRATALEAFTRFHSLHEQRVTTITSLADSRFDWQRVMRELALILPGNVWLTTLSGTAGPTVTVEGGGGAAMRTGVPGPALEIAGCATSHDAVAGFIQALKEIDGVTRVGVESSEVAEAEGESSSSSGCQTRNFIAQFQMVVAFDAAPPPLETSEEGEEVAPEAATTETESTTASSETEGG